MDKMFGLIVWALLVSDSSVLAFGKPQRVSDETDRIMNGGPADEGEFPSMLVLRNYGSSVCGASILNEDWALTTASCVTALNINGISVLSGSNDIHPSNGTVHNATEVVIHPDHVTYGILINDIALIKVTLPFDLDGIHRKPLKLPQAGSETAEFSTGTVVGWGKTYQGGPPSNSLQKADLVISDQAACRVFMHSSIGLDLVDTQICADVPQDGLGSCFGDGGGPLFVNDEAVGLISWAEGCAPIAYEYSIFTRVSAYIDWISSTIGRKLSTGSTTR